MKGFSGHGKQAKGVILSWHRVALQRSSLQSLAKAERERGTGLPVRKKWLRAALGDPSFSLFLPSPAQLRPPGPRLAWEVGAQAFPAHRADAGGCRGQRPRAGSQPRCQLKDLTLWEVVNLFRSVRSFYFSRSGGGRLTNAN